MPTQKQNPSKSSVKTSHSSGRVPETLSGFFVSLLFWLTLLTAAVLFGIVGLTPKLLERARLRDQFQTNQLHLIQVEHQNEQLQRVVDAIRNDKEFAAEMTRVEFDAVRADEEIIPVDADLQLVPRNLVLTQAPAATPPAWHKTLIVPFAESDTLRMILLGAAALLVLVSFTWLQPVTGQPSEHPATSRQSVWQLIRARYIRPV
jgi:hypothetical protein